ncbi:MAG TPA: AAA family ATPase [Bacillota bacterium]
MRKGALIGGAAAILLFLFRHGLDPIPFLLIGGAFSALRFYMQGRGLERNFETIQAVHEKEVVPRVTFSDIGGQDRAKRELLEALDFLKEEATTKALGIRPLKGILLTGPPGTGKTLMAKAAAFYTDAVFLASSGAEFIEMYAGVGAQRVRQLFSRARKMAEKAGKKTAIIFLDELEVMGGKRGKHTSHLEYDQTLNQLLVEMDGLKTDQTIRILVIAATNRADLLDEALLRPGRFDRQVRVDLPEKEGRLKILEIHSKNKPLSPEVDLSQIAQETIGFSGAHLEALMNEAAILAFRKGCQQIGTTEIEEAIDKVILGERLERRPLREEMDRVAVHETGHAFISEVLRPSSVAALTVTSRGKALGFMRPVDKEERHLYPKKYLEDQIAICLGGAVAEEVFFGEKSTGASNDFEQAAQITKEIIKSGLSELGLVDPEFTPKEMMHEVFSTIINRQEAMVRQIIQENKDLIRKIASTLFSQERLSGEEFRRMMDGGVPATEGTDEKEQAAS